jgi:predicted DsbA family dithiol-disulfide isomerase
VADVEDEGAAVQVEIWSDVVCPWCYIGKRGFEAALARFDQRDRVEVTWRSFELDPSTTSATADRPDDGTDYADRLAAKYGTSREGAQQMLDTMTARAAEEGLDFRFDRAARANTFDAHQVLHLAGEHGRQDAVKERLLRGYFTEGELVGDREVLVRLAAEAGLDADLTRAALHEQRYAAAVRADEEEAHRLGVGGVPFFVVDRRYAASGAQPAGQLLEVLRRTWAETQPLTVLAGDPVTDASTDASCGPDGCTV